MDIPDSPDQPDQQPQQQPDQPDPQPEQKGLKPRRTPAPGFARDLLGGVDIDALLAVDITDDFEDL